MYLKTKSIAIAPITHHPSADQRQRPRRRNLHLATSCCDSLHHSSILNSKKLITMGLG